MLTDRDQLIYKQLSSYELDLFGATDEVGDNSWMDVFHEVKDRLIDLGLLEKTPRSYLEKSIDLIVGKRCWRRTERGERIYDFHKAVKKVLDIR